MGHRDSVNFYRQIKELRRSDPRTRGLPAETIAKLKAMGRRVKIVDDGVVFGGYQAILKNPSTGVYAGATEMHKDGAAIRY